MTAVNIPARFRVSDLQTTGALPQATSLRIFACLRLHRNSYSNRARKSFAAIKIDGHQGGRPRLVR